MLYPVILCGGSGTRLWPLSRALYPKQFVDLGKGRTLFKDTLLRAHSLTGIGAPIVVCNENHRFYVSTAFLECETNGQIILEPAPRNTAPAIALSAFAAQEKNSDDDPLLLVLPSDHLLKDDALFVEAVSRAITLAEQNYIVTFGVTPAGPETGFGYIHQGPPLGAEGFRVERFVEKPQIDAAQAMLKQGGYLWNSGMFLFKASLFLQELRRTTPDIFDACAKAWKTHRTEGAFIFLDTESFLLSPADSIDYTVMEQTPFAAVCPLHTDWNDLGSWEAFYQMGTKDADGNVCEGDILSENTHSCYLHSTNRLVTTLDVSDLAIIETKDSVLVASRSSIQDVKKIVNELKKSGRSESRVHPLVYRPWGSYESLAIDSRFQVKRITVNPGAELSLQMHYHRAEHWVVVSGTAEITNGENVQLFTENQSTYIPLGTIHRLKNPGSIPLVIIEIQSGSYLGEDDIVRLEDHYGRI